MLIGKNTSYLYLLNYASASKEKKKLPQHIFDDISDFCFICRIRTVSNTLLN